MSVIEVFQRRVERKERELSNARKACENFEGRKAYYLANARRARKALKTLEARKDRVARKERELLEIRELLEARTAA